MGKKAEDERMSKTDKIPLSGIQQDEEEETDDDETRSNSTTHDTDCELTAWIRTIWGVGSNVEIHQPSGSDNDQWFKGVIEKIYDGEDDKQWLQIKYQNETKVKLQRDDTANIRPLSTALSIYKYVYNAIATKSKNELDTQTIEAAK